MTQAKTTFALRLLDLAAKAQDAKVQRDLQRMARQMMRHDGAAAR